MLRHGTSTKPRPSIALPARLAHRLPPPPTPIFDQPSPVRSQTSSNRTSESNKSRRSTSPVKTTDSLDRLTNPVRFPALEDNAVAQLPEDARELYGRIWDIVVEHQKILPVEIRHEIESVAGRRLATHWFREAGTDGGDEQTDEVSEAGGGSHGGMGGGSASYYEDRRRRKGVLETRQIYLAQLDELVDIKAAADVCRQLNRHEMAWNMLVHFPLLQLAFGSNPRQRVEPVTSVAIAQAFVPRWDSAWKAASTQDSMGSMVDSKKIDFVVTLSPPAGPLNTAIRAAIAAQPAGMDTVNPNDISATALPTHRP